MVPRQLQDWTRVVKEVRAEHPHLSFKEVLKMAKPIYHNMKKSLGLGRSAHSIGGCGGRSASYCVNNMDGNVESDDDNWEGRKHSYSVRAGGKKKVKRGGALRISNGVETRGVPQQTSTWMNLVRTLKIENPHLTLKQVLEAAKPIYARLKREGRA